MNQVSFDIFIINTRDIFVYYTNNQRYLNTFSSRTWLITSTALISVCITLDHVAINIDEYAGGMVNTPSFSGLVGINHVTCFR